MPARRVASVADSDAMNSRRENRVRSRCAPEMIVPFGDRSRYAAREIAKGAFTGRHNYRAFAFLVED